MSLGEDVLEKGYFQLITNDSCRPDILLFSKKPSDTIKVSMPEMSTLIRTRIEALLINSLIPDIEFIEKNTLFYSVPAKSEKITITNSNRANPWQKGYDIAYLTYKVNELSFLLAFTGTHAWGSTYVYIKTTNKGESDKIDEDLLSKILTKEALDMIRFVEPGGPDDSVINFPPPIIPTYFISQTICLVRAVWFGNTATPSTDYRLNEWFSYSKKSIALQKESETKEMIRKKLITEWMEKCKNLILTGQGRAELIALIGSGHREAEFEGDVYRYKRFRELPYNALREYYSNYKDEKAEELARYSAWSPEKITPVEAEALRKLLQSDDKSVLEFALLLIEEGRGRSLVADLLKLQADQIVAPRLLLRRRGVPQRVYHFLVYKLLGKLGDGQTLKVLKERLKDDKNSEPVKADIELAVDDIQRHIVAHQRQKQAWLDLRRSVREKKVFTIGEIIDMDKPDP
ncbi:MAG: hypothetical protein LBG80_02835, partial [Bacteroidales bacterium]|nr:hypothetical protein [Bacteroidales bacterium]